MLSASDRPWPTRPPGYASGCLTRRSFVAPVGVTFSFAPADASSGLSDRERDLPRGAAGQSPSVALWPEPDGVASGPARRRIHHGGAAALPIHPRRQEPVAPMAARSVRSPPPPHHAAA